MRIGTLSTLEFGESKAVLNSLFFGSLLLFSDRVVAKTIPRRLAGALAMVARVVIYIHVLDNIYTARSTDRHAIQRGFSVSSRYGKYSQHHRQSSFVPWAGRNVDMGKSSLKIFHASLWTHLCFSAWPSAKPKVADLLWKASKQRTTQKAEQDSQKTAAGRGCKHKECFHLPWLCCLLLCYPDSIINSRTFFRIGLSAFARDFSLCKWPSH